MIFTHLAGRPRPLAPATVPGPPSILRELLVADGASADIGELVTNARIPLLLIEPAGNALQALTGAIAAQPLDVLHLAAHGRAGALSLGGQWIGTRTLAAASGMLIQWKVATIALWSCHSGKDHTLAEVLAALTGARVLVSSGALGMVDGQPRWELAEAGAGSAQQAQHGAGVAAPFNSAVMATWPHQLAPKVLSSHD